MKLYSKKKEKKMKKEENTLQSNIINLNDILLIINFIMKKL